jgi:hypothetical protein
MPDRLPNLVLGPGYLERCIAQFTIRLWNAIAHSFEIPPLPLSTDLT